MGTDLERPTLSSPAGVRLYERTAPLSGELEALWHLDEGRTFFAGPLDYNASHQHGAPVYLAGLYGSFGLRVEGGRWLSVRTAVIPAGVRHELQLGGHPIGVFYIEPDLAGADALVPLVRDTREDHGALVGRTGEVGALRALYEDATATRWAGAALGDLLGFSRRRARREMDSRIARVVAGMSGRVAAPGELTPVACLAGEVGLSASRSSTCSPGRWGCRFDGIGRGSGCEQRSPRSCGGERLRRRPIRRGLQIRRISGTISDGPLGRRRRGVWPVSGRSGGAPFSP
jgi:hypothetical protein